VIAVFTFAKPAKGFILVTHAVGRAGRIRTVNGEA